MYLSLPIRISMYIVNLQLVRSNIRPHFRRSLCFECQGLSVLLSRTATSNGGLITSLDSFATISIGSRSRTIPGYMLHDTLIAIEKASCEVQTWVTHGGVRATASTEVSEIERELTSI